MNTSTSIIQLDNVSRTFREGSRSHAVLSDVSMTVAPGEFVVLLGKSGSGKTTLLHLIAGIESADSGTVIVAGENLTAANDRERTLFRRRRLGIIFQSLNLIPTLTVRENVELRLELNRIRDADRIARGEALLRHVELADRADSSPDVLSGGEQQRVAIAAALVHDPDLILADEPTGNLDTARGGEIVDLLDQLVRRDGKTLVMATHSLEMVGIADRVLTIEEGRIVEVAAGGTQA